ncbi:MAG: division/cell wall cluster transcriptional repressor MraZ [Mycoplasmatota bacterium]|nr:division/cell wall cluster transcriptional repressor MraZ [Mycoplasmatota bacterium]
MFMGEYHHTIDEKGRLIIPSKFRDGLGESFIITRGIEKCLFVYSLESWKKITNKLESLPFTKKDARQFVRFFLSGATTAEFDKQGRVNITSPLISYANLVKDCVVIGTGDRLEIWSEEDWNAFFDSAADNMSDIAENLFNESVSI